MTSQARKNQLRAQVRNGATAAKQREASQELERIRQLEARIREQSS